MKFMKIKLLVIAVIMFAASSAFASLGYDVSINTSELFGNDAYLYFQYIPVNGSNSTANVSNFVTDGTLGAQSTNVVNGSAVTGTLPGTVVFANTNGINDYNHAIHLGNAINFLISFSDPAPGGQAGGGSTFSLGGYFDEGGIVGYQLLTIDLHNDGTATAQPLMDEVTITPTPIPAAAWLLGSSLMGLAGFRRRKQI
jgi:hypothetical protein